MAGRPEVAAGAHVAEATRLADGATSLGPAESRQPAAAGATAMAHPRRDRNQRRRNTLVRHLQHYLRSLGRTGVVVALLFFAVSQTPSLLPRSWPIQGLLSGISAAGGYGVGVVIRWVFKHLPFPAASTRLQRWSWWAIWVLAAITIPVLLSLAAGWQREIRQMVGVSSDRPNVYLGVFVIAMGAFVVFLGIFRLVHDAIQGVTKLLRRFVPRSVARPIAVVLVFTITYGIFTGVVYKGAVALADSVFSASDGDTADGITQPRSPLRSGSPASVVRWDSLGTEGRTFVAAGPTQTEIAQLTGRPAIEPIRVFAGRESASTIDDEAQLVLRELERTGAFDRAVLALATSTGTGWVDPALSDPLEYMYGGNTAIAALQYSYLPSWMSFVIDRARAVQAARTLFTAVHGYWLTRPAEHRPRLVIFGESLGVYGATGAFDGIAALAADTDGALFTGPPNETPMWRDLTEHRRPGSLERLPVYGDGGTVEFAGLPANLRSGNGALSHPEVVFYQHASDPVVWWAPRLIWHRPDWLTEPKGPDVIGSMHWFPFVSFWQVSFDLVANFKVPLGHGHNYGIGPITAWQAILQPPGWTAGDTERLVAASSPTPSPGSSPR